MTDGIRICATCDAYPCICPEIRYPSADERDDAKREQQAARFAGKPPEKCVITGELAGSPFACQDCDPCTDPNCWRSDLWSVAAMDAGSSAETRTDRRIAWDALTPNQKEAVQYAVADVLIDRRHDGLEARINATIDAVLDTVAAA